MTAVLIPTASEAEWLDARRKGITASEIAVVMGLSPYSSPYALYHQKLGNLDGPEDSEAMALGRYLEQYVCDRFAAQHPEFAVTGDGRKLYAHPERSWQLATPDRLLMECGGWVDDDGNAQYPGLLAVLEAKTAAGYDGWGDDGTDEIPVHYRCQVLWQMDVMGVSTAFVACLFLHTRQLRIYEIGHADGCGADCNMLAYPSLACPACDDIAIMRDAAAEFLDRIKREDPPDVDWRPATIDALKVLHPSVEDADALVSRQLAARYHAACRNHKHWEQRKKTYEAHLRERMGSARRAVEVRTGETIARRDVFEQREHVRKATTVDKLVPVYPKESK